MINKVIFKFTILFFNLLTCLMITSCTYKEGNVIESNELNTNYEKIDNINKDEYEESDISKYPKTDLTLYDMTMMLWKHLGNENKIYKNKVGKYTILGTANIMSTDLFDFDKINIKIEQVKTGDEYNYPKIIMNDKKKEKLINDLIYNNLIVHKVLQSYKAEERDIAIISYLMSANENYISFKLATYEEFYGGSRVSMVEYFGGLTIDIKNAKVLRLDDVIIDIDKLINDMCNKENFCWFADLMVDTPEIPPEEGTYFFQTVNNELKDRIIKNIKNDLDVSTLEGIDSINHHSIFFIHETGIYIATNLSAGIHSGGRWIFIPMDNLKDHLLIDLE